jgi:hypothetical protein
LDISHGSPRDERTPGVFFFGVFFFDGFYSDSTGVVADQPSVEAAPGRGPQSAAKGIITAGGFTTRLGESLPALVGDVSN